MQTYTLYSLGGIKSRLCCVEKTCANKAIQRFGVGGAKSGQKPWAILYGQYGENRNPLYAGATSGARCENLRGVRKKYVCTETPI